MCPPDMQIAGRWDQRRGEAGGGEQPGGAGWCAGLIAADDASELNAHLMPAADGYTLAAQLAARLAANAR